MGVRAKRPQGATGGVAFEADTWAEYQTTALLSKESVIVSVGFETCVIILYDLYLVHGFS